MSPFGINLIFLNLLIVISPGTFTSLGRKARHKDFHWGYGDLNGHWKGKCQTGKNQSPINIKPSAAVEVKLPPFRFGDYYSQKSEMEGVNNGHTLEVKLTNKTIEPIISGGGLEDDYIFKQLHFHWGSEHLMEGKRAALEMHVVHYNSKYDGLKAALSEPEGLAVIAVLFYESNLTRAVVENFFKRALKDAVDTSDETSHEVLETSDEDDEAPFNNYSLRDLLPDNIDTWYRYKGSLTTPGCDESVVWTIMENRLPVSRDILRSLKTLKSSEESVLQYNFRPEQNLNGRTVYVQIDTIEDLDSDENLQAVKEEEPTSNAMLLIPSHLTIFCIYYIVNIVNYSRTSLNRQGSEG